MRKPPIAMPPLGTDSIDASETTRWMRFRMIHLVYVVTLLASALATFGALGLLPGGLVCVFWAIVFASRSRPKGLQKACLAMLALFCFLCFVSPMVNGAREAARRMSCTNNLKMIALALHNYHGLHGTFPPAFIADAQGRPMHSWRVLILPFIPEQGLYAQYDFDEPWDGPNNSKLADSMPRIYACPSWELNENDQKRYTSYVGVVGPGTAWPGATAVALKDITDGTANTVLVLEYNHQPIMWLEPRDLAYDEALDVMATDAWGVATNHKADNFFYEYPGGRVLALADGSVHFAASRMNRRVCANLFNIDDGESLSDDCLDGELAHSRRPRIGNWIRLGFFMLLTVFPLPWVWITPSAPTAKS